MIDFRALEPIDVDTLYRWENDPAVWGVGSTMAPYSRKQLWAHGKKPVFSQCLDITSYICKKRVRWRRILT